MRYVIKAVKDFGAPYVKANKTTYDQTYRKTLDGATFFNSLVEAIDGIMAVNVRGEANRGELTVIGVEEVVPQPQYREVAL